MMVVLDTSCISAFLRINQISILLDILQGHSIVLTEQVSYELRLAQHAELRNFQHPKFQIRAADSGLTKKYPIHLGEASVIAFAKEHGALAVIDDKKTREAAHKEGIPFVGTSTLIKFGLKRNIIRQNDIESLLADITGAGRLYLNDEIRKWIRGLR